jgi:hypothetical protein
VGQEHKDTTFRVIDRRMFTEQGDLRPEAEEQIRKESTEPKAGPQTAGSSGGNAAGVVTSSAGKSAGAGGSAKESAAPSAATASQEAPTRSPYFEMLLNLLANQAAAMLGAYADPQTGQAVVDLDAAHEFIDMLDALREKTRGNLTAEEDNTLTEVVGSLKYSYMQMTKSAVAARAGGAKPAPGSRR